MVLQESGKISAILDDLRLMVPFLSAYKSHYGAGNASETFAAGAVSGFWTCHMACHITGRTRLRWGRRYPAMLRGPAHNA